MIKAHVGSGTSYGALGVFPVWGEQAVERDYSTAVSAVRVGEKDDPEVPTLIVGNASASPLLLVEGQLLEGGLQNRMVARSVVVEADDELAVDVVCVEQGRWGGRRRHTDARRRATTRVQSSVRAAGGNQQGEVWRRIAEYEGRYGRNATSSFTEHASRADKDVAPVVRNLRPFPGQIGVVIAIGGQPVSAELFDSPETLAEQFASIVTAAAMDAVGQPDEITPSRRVRRFIDRATAVDVRPSARAGTGVTLTGASEDASISLLHWRDRDVHTSVLNPRHELVGAM